MTKEQLMEALSAWIDQVGVEQAARALRAVTKQAANEIDVLPDRAALASQMKDELRGVNPPA